MDDALLWMLGLGKTRHTNLQQQLPAGMSSTHRLTKPLPVLQAMWSEFTQDGVVDNNVTGQFCTEALTIQAPHERMTDRWAIKKLAMAPMEVPKSCCCQSTQCREQTLSNLYSNHILPGIASKRVLVCKLSPHSCMWCRLIRSLSTGKGFLLLLSRLWVPSSRLGGIPQWPLTASFSDEEFGDALCHRSWNLTVSY